MSNEEQNGFFVNTLLAAVFVSLIISTLENKLKISLK